jgi:hypothetical protein
MTEQLIDKVSFSDLPIERRVIQSIFDEGYVAGNVNGVSFEGCFFGSLWGTDTISIIEREYPKKEKVTGFWNKLGSFLDKLADGDNSWRRPLIGQIYLGSHWKNDDPCDNFPINRCTFEVYGQDNVKKMKVLAGKLAEKYKMNINLKLMTENARLEADEDDYSD